MGNCDKNKRSRTRKLLIEAALRIYAHKNLDSVSIHEIAIEAGVSHGTIYNYFRTRTELFQCISTHLAADLVERVVIAYHDIRDPAERIAVAVRLTFAHAARHTDCGWVILRFCGLDAEFDEMVTSHARTELRLGLMAGRFSYEAEDAAVALITGSILMALRPVLSGTAAPNHSTEVARLVLMGLGIPAEEARKISTLPLPNFSV